MTRLEAHKKELYELRFSPMCKPAAEVANLTQLESHTTRSRVMMFWRIAEGHLQWGDREAELIYETTLDSISEAFDVFHYPVSTYMLDARADVWQAGLAPQLVKDAVASVASKKPSPQKPSKGDVLVLAGEIALLEDQQPYVDRLETAFGDAAIWVAPTGAVPYSLGAWDAARSLGEIIIQGIAASGARTVIADGPQTAWALEKILPALELQLPEGVKVELLSDVLNRSVESTEQELGKVFFHDSRSAYHLSESPPTHLAVMPGYKGDDAAFGDGLVYQAPRSLLEKLGADLVFGTWARGLSKSCGADDGLWLTHPELAVGLSAQRLDYARQLGAAMIVTDSPLCSSYLAEAAGEEDINVGWLPSLTPGE